MHTGRLRHRITIQRTVETQSGTGETTYTWLTIATVWASVNDLSGRELLQADAGSAEVTVRVILRYVESVTPLCRILHGSRTLEIVHVNNVQGRQKEYELLCREAAVVA